MAAAIPLARLGSVEDIGHAALFFASKEAAYITGQSLVIDGGRRCPSHSVPSAESRVLLLEALDAACVERG